MMYNDKFKVKKLEEKIIISIKTMSNDIHDKYMNFSSCHVRIIRLHPINWLPTYTTIKSTVLYNNVKIIS